MVKPTQSQTIQAGETSPPAWPRVRRALAQGESVHQVAAETGLAPGVVRIKAMDSGWIQTPAPAVCKAIRSIAWSFEDGVRAALAGEFGEAEGIARSLERLSIASLRICAAMQAGREMEAAENALDAADDDTSFDDIMAGFDRIRASEEGLAYDALRAEGWFDPTWATSGAEDECIGALDWRFGWDTRPWERAFGRTG